MQEFDRILVPTDGSEHTEFAVTKAISLAKLLDRPLVGLFVLDYHAFEPYPHEGVLVDLRKILEKESERALADITRKAKAAGVRAETRLLEGHPEEEIVKAAKPTDLIVISTHGRSGLKRLLLGSVAETVVRHAPCPVLVVRKAPR